MGGHWTYRDADVHRCDFPKHESTIRTGDRWKCDECRQEWEVEVKYHFDPRPGESYGELKWNKYTAIPSVTAWRDR